MEMPGVPIGCLFHTRYTKPIHKRTMARLNDHKVACHNLTQFADQHLSPYSYLQMLNLSNEAIRRMYIACRDKGCFPGHLPIDGHDRNISIHAILEGLGLLTDGMLPSDAPSEEFGWRCPSQPNVYDARPPRAKSGSSNITMDDIDGTSLQRVNGFPSSNSAHSSTSQQSFDDIAISPTTAVHSFNSIQQHHDTGSSYLHNLDFISFCSQSNAIPMDGLANTATTGTAPLLNDFLIPWPATFAVEMHSTEY